MQALGGRSVHPGLLSSLSRAVGSLGPLAHAPCVVWFIGCRWVQSCVPPLGSMGSFRVVGFTLARPGGRSVLSCAPWKSLGSFGVIGFIRARPGGRWVYPGTFGSLARALWVVEFTRRAFPGGLSVHPGPLGSLARAKGVVGFIPCR